MSDIVILNDGMPVYTTAFPEQPKINIFGLVDGFKYGGVKHKYFDIQYYIKPVYFNGQVISNPLINGYYKEDLFFKHLYYINNPNMSNIYSAETLLKEGYLPSQNLQQYEATEGEIVTIKANDFSMHNFYYEEMELKFNIQKDEDGKIKRYANNGESNFPQTTQDGLISKVIVTNNNLSSSPTGKFYFKNFGDPQQNWDMLESSKVEFDKVITLICFRIYWIEQEIFPLITNNLALVNQLGSGSIPSTNPNVTELIKALAEIKKYWGFYQTMEPFFDIINPKNEEYSTYYRSLVKFYEEIDKIRYNLFNKTDDEKLVLISQLLSGEALKILPLSTRKYLIKKYAYQKNLIDSDEEQVLKLINTININDQNEVNDFLGWLIDEKEKKITGNQLPPFSENIYGLLYRKIDNYPNILKITEIFGDKSFSKDNKTRFVNAILVLWSESKYNPYKNMINGLPDLSLIDNSEYTYDKTYKHSAIINYISEKKYGIYNDDFVFAFDPWARGIYFIIDKDYRLIASSDYNHIYQPVTLVHYPSENDTAIQLPYKDGEFNGMIPLFFLKYVDDYGDDQDLFTKIGYFVDVATIPTGIGNLAKLRHLRHLSKLGQLLLVIEVVNLSKDIIEFLMNFVCNDTNEFCKKIKTILTFLEIFSLVEDPIVIAKIKKTAELIIEQALNNGWPSEFSVPINGETPKQKIEELAGINNLEYLNKYKEKANSIFFALMKQDQDRVIERGEKPRFELYYSGFQLDQLYETAFGKGVSAFDIAGIIHQACRIRPSGFIASLSILNQRMDNILEIRRRKYPFTRSSKLNFKNYYDTYVIPTIKAFGLPERNIRYGGSAITSTTPFGDDGQDTDWWTDWKDKDEVYDYITNIQRPRLIEWGNLQGKRAQWGQDQSRKLKNFFNKNGYLDKRSIISLQNNQAVTLFDRLKSFPTIYKTDITPTVEGLDTALPYITYNEDELI